MALFSVTGLSFVIVRCGQSEEAAWSCKNLDALISFVEENMESTSYRIDPTRVTRAGGFVRCPAVLPVLCSALLRRLGTAASLPALARYRHWQWHCDAARPSDAPFLNIICIVFEMPCSFYRHYILSCLLIRISCT